MSSIYMTTGRREQIIKAMENLFSDIWVENDQDGYPDEGRDAQVALLRSMNNVELYKHVTLETVGNYAGLGIASIDDLIRQNT